MSDISYNVNVECTEDFKKWISKLDRSLRIRIDQRLQRMANGNPGFHKQFDNLLELKWKTGAMGSFRVYCFVKDNTILLLGGHKDTQSKDISRAKQLLKGVLDEKIRVEDYE